MKCKKCGKMMQIKWVTENEKEVVYNWQCSCGYSTTTVEQK